MLSHPVKLPARDFKYYVISLTINISITRGSSIPLIANTYIKISKIFRPQGGADSINII